MQTAIQLYSLRALDESVTQLLEHVAETRLDGVEFAGAGGEPPGEIRETVDQEGLGVAGAHVPVEAVESDLPAEASNCQLLGSDRLVIPILDESKFADPAAVADTADALSEFAESLAPYELQLCYHNHELEFAEVDNRFAFEQLVETTEGVAFELDVGWAYAAGADPVDLLDRYAEQISVVHLKDVAVDPEADRGGRPVDLGAGDVPLRECAAAAREAGVEWAVFEHDDPDDPAAFLQRADEWAADV
ncbi:Sugar phosphate isomerase/epimerase [Halogranum amylolyticum]|uniref:Sugar phosphate isomerase/epimerase n=1 Tax=Halogranum amylolyticum TaxID=660520 RepID=A0A1H8NJM4_9EURY|nr:sugar phosphate isomerase/epimerase [Halogranum amylolyticum]SEO29777.1 Sugar phosphate isomerase/epimerase [Halogranum amylolyticum]